MKASLLARAVPALLLTGLLAGGLATPALAQTEAGSAAHNEGTQTSMHHGAASDQTLVERRIEDMHARLKITHAQEAKWHAFTRVMQENARDMDQAYRKRAAALPHMTALQDLESYAQLQQTRTHDVERLVPAFSHLYAALSPQQKHAADEMFRAYARKYQHPAQASSR